jgi:hypothetical protein
MWPRTIFDSLLVFADRLNGLRTVADRRSRTAQGNLWVAFVSIGWGYHPQMINLMYRPVAAQI